MRLLPLHLEFLAWCEVLRESAPKALHRTLVAFGLREGEDDDDERLIALIDALHRLV